MKFLQKFYGWLSIFFPLVIGALFITQVNLQPQIKPDFFFSSDSKIYKQDQKIYEKFVLQQQLIINIDTAGSITDPNYLEVVRKTSEDLLAIDGIASVQSITHGPQDLEAARTNPLWETFLIGEGEKTSSIIAFLSTEKFTPLIKEVEGIIDVRENRWFDFHMSGLPYIVEQIKRNLTQDMKRFAAGAIILSALMLLIIFRSFVIVAGAMITCISTAMLTLVIQAFMGIPIGILTANLGIIVFVLTLSHIIFLIANWYNDCKDDKTAKFQDTIKHTFSASFWAAVTTLLGFASLIFVEAKPLNQLGTGGTIGTICALIGAYTIFPAFLKLAKIKPGEFTFILARKFPLPKKIASGLTSMIAVIALGLGLIGLPLLNTDPSLLSYFKEGTKLHSGIEHVDKNGGSNPLLFVISRADGEKLDNDESYERMWELQKDLSDHEAVGSVVSLPLIMSEGDEHWLGTLLPWGTLLDVLSAPLFGGVGESFVTEDRKEALFILRMKETGREKDRLTIIDTLKDIPPKHNFTLNNIGGTYYLQGELAASVAQSMTIGILTLIGLFSLIAFILSGSLFVTLGVMLCAAFISAIVLGTLGVLGIPVDIISSPAINICLGLIVDDMIHLTVTAKRYLREKKNKTIRDWDNWREALNTQSWPAIISTLTIMAGFSVFGLSDFPPSQRFGLEIVYGAGLAVILALGVFPFIATFKGKKSKKVKD